MIVDEFLRWIADAPVAARADATDALARAYLYSDMEQRDKVQVEAALAVQLDDPSPTVRLRLAETLSASPDAPRSVILSLLSDQPHIAAVVLKRSPILLDAELVDAVASETGLLQKAVAERFQISAPVCAALIEIGGAEICRIVLDNPGAHLASISLWRLAERFGDDPVMREKLFERHDLTVEQRQFLLTRLGDALSNMGLVRSLLPEKRAKSIMRDACDKATVMLSRDLYDEEVLALVEHLRMSEQLTPSIVLRATVIGNMRFVAAVLAALSGLSLDRVEGMLVHGRDAALRALLDKAGLPVGAHPAIFASIQVWRETAREADNVDTADFARRMLERVLTAYDDFEEEECNQLLALLRKFVTDAVRDSARAFADSCRQQAA
jgi:uncharacterized protein (DUF2336 family)